MKKRFLGILLVICMVLMLVPIPVNAMSLYVDLSIIGGATLTIEVESGDSIANVKEKIKTETGYSETIQMLKYDGTVLQNGRTLADYNIQKNSIIELSFAPRVQAYATKEQLMDDTFAPNSNGTAANIGKLVFGKNSSGAPQEWYILGKDNGVSGDNTIIFAASPIVTGKKFEDDNQNNKTDASLWGDCVYNGANPLEVYPNHYGASDLRVALNNMVIDNDYFTTAEKNMMNATTVTTKDTKNNSNYTTTDKLYVLSADGYDASNRIIKAGSSTHQTVLAMDSYWKNENRNQFWLRSPNEWDTDFGSYHVLVAVTGDAVNTSCTVDYTGGNDVKPASNLNLSSVLFASAAQAASSGTETSGTINKDSNGEPQVMTLRLDGSSQNIGTALYNAMSGDIKATKGSTTNTVALVIQGNDGTNDWYYSKQFAGTETVTVNTSEIKSALGTSADINLSVCKIWLETTDSTERMIYAVNATEIPITGISSVEITGINNPTAHTALDTEASCVTTGVSSTTPSVTWTPNDSTAGYNTSYTASITLTADTGYEFTDSTTATVNGTGATSVTKNPDGTLTVIYDFSTTAKDKLLSITAPQPITVESGTAYDAMNLPATVEIVTEGRTVTSASVEWDKTTPASGNYGLDVLTAQTVTLKGTVTCPETIDANGVSLTTTIAITYTIQIPDTKSPQTGDNSHMTLWITLLFVSGGLLTVTGIYGKMKKYRR